MGDTEQWDAGKRVRAARISAGLSQRSAARLAGVSPTRWGQVESGWTTRGNRTYRTAASAQMMARICNTLGLDLKEILPLAGIPAGEIGALGLKPSRLSLIEDLSQEEVDKVALFIEGLRAARN